MAEKTLSNVKIQLRNDVKGTWESRNPVLSKGEFGIEIDTNKFKIGDGIKTWDKLSYAGVIVSKSSTNGNVIIDGSEVTVYTLPIAGSALGGVKTSSGLGKVTVAGDGTMSVSSVASANQLSTARTISLAGDVTGSATFNGSANAPITATLANSGVTAGTYTKVTVDTKGRVTKGTTLTSADIPTLTLAKISDAGTVASKNVGSSAGQVPILGSDGKLDTSILPQLAITETHVVDSQSAMLALQAQTGDIAVRTDVNETFILKASPAATLDNWVKLANPTASGFVSSINGKTGAVTLTTSNITEGSNLYYTESRATANFTKNFSAKNPVLQGDTLTLDCGNA